MAKRMEELAKNLASGMSRRKAFTHFLFGSGVTLFGAKKAAARPGNSICVEFCASHGVQAGWDEFGACVSASAKCPHGSCAVMLNGHQVICVPVGY